VDPALFVVLRTNEALDVEAKVDPPLVIVNTLAVGLGVPLRALMADSSETILGLY